MSKQNFSSVLLRLDFLIRFIPQDHAFVYSCHTYAYCVGDELADLQNQFNFV